MKRSKGKSLSLDPLCSLERGAGETLMSHNVFNDHVRPYELVGKFTGESKLM